jgi:hypothetical protein
MAVEPMRMQPAMFQARRTALKTLRDAPRRAWRSTKMALLAGELWLLVAVVLAAAGAGGFGILFAGVAVLWIWIAAVDARDTRSLSESRKVHAHARRLTMPFYD